MAFKIAEGDGNEPADIQRKATLELDKQLGRFMNDKGCIEFMFDTNTGQLTPVERP